MPERMLVAAVGFTAPGPPAVVPHEDGGLIVHLIHQLEKGRFPDQPVCPDGTFKKPEVAVGSDPCHSAGVGTALLTAEQHADKDLVQIFPLGNAPSLLTEDDAYLSAHRSFSLSKVSSCGRSMKASSGSNSTSP